MFKIKSTIIATSAPSSPGNISSTTLVPSNEGGSDRSPAEHTTLGEQQDKKTTPEKPLAEQTPTKSAVPSKSSDQAAPTYESISATSSPLHMQR